MDKHTTPPISKWSRHDLDLESGSNIEDLD